MSNHILYFGFGYTAKATMPFLLQANFLLSGTHRSSQFSVLPSVDLLEFNSPRVKQLIANCSHMLISIPPHEAGGDMVLSTYADQIAAYAANIQWVGYLSSTGVYGDHQGAWVNEESDCHPLGSSAVARFSAENSWLTFAKRINLPLHVFRLAGIYGSGRNALTRIQSGKKHSILKEGHYFSRIHVEDIASVIMASINAPNPFSIYNVADDEPTPGHIVDNYAAKLLGVDPLPLIPYQEAATSPMEQQFYASNRRVSNTKIKTELQIKLKYPSYREGLDQIWAQDFAATN